MNPDLSTTPAPLDLALSIAVAERIQADLKRCWMNALHALRTQPTLRDGWYVEGWAVFESPFPVEHGWVELQDSRIVDPTHALLVLTRTRERAGEPSIPTYFPGVKYTRAELKGVRVDKLPHVYSFGGFGGWQHEPYKKAYFDAWAYCGKPEIGQDPLLR